MKNKRYFLSRVSSTEECDRIYFCYVEVEDSEMFSADLQRMNMAFVQSQLIFQTVSVDFAEPGAVRTFYLGSDEEDILENLFEANCSNGEDKGIVELKSSLSEDFLEKNAGEARIGEYRIRFVGEFQATFVGRYKHFSGDVETDFICQDLMTGDDSEVISAGKDFSFVCAVCGSENVSAKCWADPKTDEVIDYISDEKEDNFCEDCGKSVRLRTIELTTSFVG